jgi:glutamyl-tRNA reductase
MTQALRDRFEAIRQTELERLNKKLRGFSDEDRQSLESITADIIRAIATIPEQALAAGAAQPSVDALVRLFALDAVPRCAAR